ncbi:MAG: stage III sporulation protein AE [Clostridia bacterium]|nr:stage III sporulation protein AE [Clostridia bacterium]
MKRKILYMFFLLMIFVNSFTYAQDTDVMAGQKENFGIASFVKEAEKYSSDFFEDTDISNLLDSAISGKIDNNSIYSKILELLGKEAITSLKTITYILIIIVIHSILKSISDSLENSNISQIMYYVQYILIVTVIMQNFSEIIQMVKDTSNNLVGFMNALVPLLIALMLYTGSIVTSSVVEPIILLMINFLGNCINIVLIPTVLIITALSIISKLSDKVQLSKLSKLLNSGVIWFLGIGLTLFVATISLEGTLSSSVDGISAKTAKAAVSTAIPVVGKILR